MNLEALDIENLKINLPKKFNFRSKVTSEPCDVKTNLVLVAFEMREAINAWGNIQ